VNVRYTVHALADLDHALAYVAERSPNGARKVHLRIQAIIDLLMRFPLMGSPTDDPTIRRITTTPFPYLIFYEAGRNEIIIHAVRHGARKPSDMPGSEGT
jgi:plasmid stabilization system protein ParE